MAFYSIVECTMCFISYHTYIGLPQRLQRQPRWSIRITDATRRRRGISITFQRTERMTRPRRVATRLHRHVSVSLAGVLAACRQTARLTRCTHVLDADGDGDSSPLPLAMTSASHDLLQTLSVGLALDWIPTLTLVFGGCCRCAAVMLRFSFRPLTNSNR